MSQDKSYKKQAPFGARLLIMLYGAGIVMLGVHPIQKEFGSFWHFVEVKILGHEFDLNNNIAKKLPRREIAKVRRDTSREKISWFSRKLASLKNFQLPSRAKERVIPETQNSDLKIKTPKLISESARARLSWPKISWPKSNSSVINRDNRGDLRNDVGNSTRRLRAEEPDHKKPEQKGFLESLFSSNTVSSSDEPDSEHHHALDSEDRLELDSLLADLP